MPSIADVYVSVIPETRQVASGIERALREADPKVAEAGRRWGREIERGIGDVKVDVKADTTKAKAEIDAAARDRDSTIHVNVDKDRLEQTMQDGISQMGPRLAGSAASAGSSIGASMGAALTPVLMAAGVTALAGVASSLSGLGGLIPGAVAGGGALFGTLALGLDGVKDAWDAAGKAADGSGKEQASQAKAVASAQKELRGAVQDESQAQKDVANARKDALRQLRDLNLELSGGKLDERQAILDVQAAERDLQTGRFRDRIEYEQAQLRVDEAEQRLAETRQRNTDLVQKANDAQAAGVDNAPNVVAANQRLAQSHERVADAQQSINEAQSQAGSSAEAAAAAMAKLSPNAQSFLNTLMSMKPAFQDFKNSVQDALFVNMGPMFQQLAGTYLPMLQTSLSQMATLVNQAFGQIGNLLMQPATMQAIQTILSNVNRAFQEFTPTILTLTQAFIRMTEVGSGFLPQLGQIINHVATEFANWVNGPDFAAFIQDGLTALQQLVPIGFQLLGMFRDLAPISGPVLNAISVALQAMAPYMPGLASAFAQLVTSLTPLIPAIADTLLPLLQHVMELLSAVGGFLGDHPGLVQAVIDIWLVFKGLQLIDHLAGVAGGIKAIATAATQAATGSGLATLAGAFAPFLAGGAIAAGLAVIGGEIWGIMNQLNAAPSHQNIEDILPNIIARARGGDGSGRGVIGSFGAGKGVVTNPFGSGREGIGALGSVPSASKLFDWQDVSSSGSGWGGAWGGAPKTSAPAIPSAMTPSITPQSIQNATTYAQSQSGKPYGYRGVGPGSQSDSGPGLFDCSGFVSDLYAVMTGKPYQGTERYFTTEDDLTKLGFVQTTTPMPGYFQVGIHQGGGGKSSHMAGTLPNSMNVESGGNGTQYGSLAAGAWDKQFEKHYYLPSSNLPGVLGSSPLTSAAPLTGPQLGTQQSPMYVDYGPSSQFGKQSGGEQLGQDIFSGIAQIFGFDGSLFKDPTSMGGFKLFKGLMGALTGGGNKQGMPASYYAGGDGASLASPGGGDMLGGAVSVLQGIIPQPFGELMPGSPGQAPGQYQPLLPGSGFTPNATRGPIDNSITVNTTGTVQQGLDAANQANIPRMRQGLRNLP